MANGAIHPARVPQHLQCCPRQIGEIGPVLCEERFIDAATIFNASLIFEVVSEHTFRLMRLTHVRLPAIRRIAYADQLDRLYEPAAKPIETIRVSTAAFQPHIRLVWRVFTLRKRREMT